MKTILVVDDDPLALTLVKDILGEAGYTVITASNGSSGLDAAIEKKPNLILLDVMMPEVDGYITLDELKKHEATKNIPVIMMTAIRFELNKQLAMEMGAVDYITKPLHTRDLPAKVFQYAGV